MNLHDIAATNPLPESVSPQAFQEIKTAIIAHLNSSNTIKWVRHRITKGHKKIGETVYSASGPFQRAGNGAFVIEFGSTIGKPYRLAFIDNTSGVRQLIGCYKTVSGAKGAAKKFGTWRN